MNSLLSKIIGLAIVGIIGMLTACSPVTLPPKQNYNLVAQLPAPQVKQRSQIVLLVSRMTAQASVSSNKMAYTQSNYPYQVSYFAEHFWLNPPAKLIMPNIINSLSQSGLFKAVVVAPYGEQVDYRLDSDLQTLQQQFTGKQSQIILVIRTELTHVTTNQIVADRVFKETVTVNGNGPQAGVVAANQALSQFLVALNTWLETTPR